ncbi:MAG: helicase HerA domain-containing protein [Chloroflexota bacterium]
MPFIEAPTTFYLGRRYDPRAHRLTDDVVYYDSRDLTTHAVVVGMTGSGKTGLCITMLEEAILDNIPAIIIDPKGDITNLLLTFPDLKPEDFEPWVNVDDTRRAGLDVSSYAADVAQRWRDGLQSWGIVPDRLKWMQLATQMSIYTPGSEAGLPISILASLRAPREGWAGNEEGIREKLNGITTALLALAGISAQPVQDAEHVIVANIIEHAWRQGIDLSLEDIILQVQKPPFERLGVMPVDQVMSERKRFNLAMELNNIIASPSFRESWLQGQSLDVQSLLYQPNGRPRVSIFYIAHLNEAERMFIITLLLENMLSWMRTLGGTTSLRALLYIDEMFGYFPPYPKNPPTKEPILRLLKQARAFGIGLIMATQNPGDLDYKGLTNTGTWFIGRLQSDNDRDKVMAGLRQMATAQDAMPLEQVEDLIADIAPRVFLMRNVHDDEGPLLLHTRWAMSFLRGPLTRQQISTLMARQRRDLLQQVAQQYGQQKRATWQQQAGIQAQAAPGAPQGLAGGNFQAQAAPGGAPGGGHNGPPAALPGTNQGGFSAQNAPPGNGGGGQTRAIQHGGITQPTATGRGLPPGFTQHPPPVSSSQAQYYLPVRTQPSSNILIYRPALLAQAVVRYQDRKAGVYTARIFTYAVPEVRQAGLIHWDEYQIDPIDSRQIDREPRQEAIFGELETGMTDSKRLNALKSELTDMLYNTAMLVIPFNPDLKIYGSPDMDFNEFQAAVQQAAREQRDAEMDKISAQYAGQMEKLEDQLRKKEQELRAEEKEIRDRRREELFTTGEALLSLWKGRTNYTLSRMSRATRYRRQTKEDIQESYETMDELERQMIITEQEFEQRLQQVSDKWTQIAQNTQEHVINPYKKDIQMELFGIGWFPAWYTSVNGQPQFVSAY